MTVFIESVLELTEAALACRDKIAAVTLGLIVGGITALLLAAYSGIAPESWPVPISPHNAKYVAEIADVAVLIGACMFYFIFDDEKENI